MCLGDLPFPRNKFVYNRAVAKSLQWRHNGRDNVSNHQPHDCLLNSLFRRRSKKTSKLRVTGLYVGNSPGTGEFPTQMASNAENVSIWWRHHVLPVTTQIARFVWPTWGPPGSCRPQVGPMLAPWTLLSGYHDVIPCAHLRNVGHFLQALSNVSGGFPSREYVFTVMFWSLMTS